MGWRDDPELFRSESEPEITVTDRRWQDVFRFLESLSANSTGASKMLVRGVLVTIRAQAAKDPDGLRLALVGVARGLVAALEVEPRELYDHLTPATPAVSEAPR